MTVTITQTSKAEQLRITPQCTTPGARSWQVENLNKGSSYLVEESAGGYTCTCKAWEYSKTSTCKHGEAIEWEQQPRLAPVASLTEYRQQRRKNKAAVDVWHQHDEASEEQAIDAGTLPDGVDPTYSKHFPDANILSGIELNFGQRQAIAEVMEWLNSSEQLHLLKGYAGTGKTTVLQALIKLLRQNQDNRRVTAVALTNKAVKVLQKMMLRWGINIECMTVCQLLGLRPKINPKTGKQEFKIDPTVDNSIAAFDLIICDECSMVNIELFELLTGAIESDLFRKQQILFVGDDAQLPPINEIGSEAFKIESQSVLTDVVRYGSSISAMATEVRENLEKRGDFYYQDDHSADRTKGVWDCELDRWQSFIERAFTSQAYQDDPDACRILAYTNKRVAFLNGIVRKAIYGELAAVEPYIRGERLIANEPCFSGKTILLQNSSECELISAQKSRTESRFSAKGCWKAWQLHVLTDEGKYRTLTVLHNDDRAEFEAELKKLAKAKKWHQFWDLKQSVHNVGYAYALTVHKSQGSTFKDVFIDIENISTNRKPAERNRLQYTALTRASHRAFIYQ